MTLLILVVAITIIIKKSTSRRSGAKRRRKIIPPLQSPTVSLEKPKSVQTSMPVQSSMRHLEQEIPMQRRTSSVPIIILSVLGTILVLGIVSLTLLSGSTANAPSIESINIGINTIISFFLIVIVAFIFALAFKIIKDSSYKHPRREIKHEYVKPKPKPSPTLTSTPKARSGAKHYSSKTIPILSLALGILIVLILAIGVYMIFTASSNAFSSENLNSILFISLIILLVIIFGVGYKYKVFNELLLGKSNTQRSKHL